MAKRAAEGRGGMGAGGALRAAQKPRAANFSNMQLPTEYGSFVWTAPTLKAGS